MKLDLSYPWYLPNAANDRNNFLNSWNSKWKGIRISLCTLREKWKKPKYQNCFKIGILVVDCTLINKWNMILSFENAKYWFLMVKGVTFTTKKWKVKWVSLSILSPHQNQVFMTRVWMNMVISKPYNPQ